ncbi:MFS transporter [Pseudalkalibacillus sp. SCS-8]|uniref:MFS transporter n=1 Tax=Pseudalkalibacillus nanhaiensis TaxID=3115291 RepID=UPI0032DA5BD5
MNLIRIIISVTFLMNVGRFSVLAFFVVYLTKLIDLPIWQGGAILSILLITHQTLPLCTGFISDRVGHKYMLLIGFLITSIGYIGIALSSHFIYLCVMAFLAGVGAALYDPAIKSIIGLLSEKQRKHTFTLFNQALNSGAVIGALAGGLLIPVGDNIPLLFGALCYFILTIFISLYLRYLPSGNSSEKALSSIKKIYVHKSFLLFLSLMTLFWVLYTQLTVSLPLQFFDVIHNKQLVSMVIITNGSIGFLLMYFIRNLFNSIQSKKMIQIGMLIMALSFFLIPLEPSLGWLILCVIIFTIGETFVLPGADIAIAEFSMYQDTGAFFGVFSLSYAIGGTIGNYLGTWLMEIPNLSSLPWLIYGMIGLIGFLLFGALNRIQEKKEFTET